MLQTNANPYLEYCEESEMVNYWLSLTWKLELIENKINDDLESIVFKKGPREMKIHIGVLRKSLDSVEDIAKEVSSNLEGGINKPLIALTPHERFDILQYIRTYKVYK